MKKTVSVNIKGTNFLVEEDAYEMLQDYIDRLTAALGTEEGSQEIIEDIELRIAEICTSMLNDSKSVVELADIEEILKTLGDPSDYVEHDATESARTESYTSSSSSNERGERRLFRDPESAMLGGVCAGFANYFGIDVVIMRVIFVLLLFTGIAVPMYIVLWIIVPKAESTIDRLRMKGRPINVETVKEEVDQAAERVRAGSKNLADRVRNDAHYNKRINRGKRILATIAGSGFIFFGFMFLIGFIIFFVQGFEFLPVKGDGGFMSITEYGELSLNSPADVKWMWIGGLLGAISGILFLFSMGVLLIFRLFNKWTKLALGALFFLGFSGAIICAVVGVKAGRDWAAETEIKDEAVLIDAEQLTIIPYDGVLNSKSGKTVKNTRNIGWFGVHGKSLSKYGVHLEYTPSPDSLFHITKVYRASGYSSKKARERSQNINYRIDVEGDSLFMDTKYLFPKEDKLRGQEVELRIQIPTGKSVLIDNRIIRLGDDHKNNLGGQVYREEGEVRSDGRYEHGDHDHEYDHHEVNINY
ncbi:MAG: PspC domain-containing protein [bacterium]|nr:PspC domain-containing protein [bacterium]